MIFVSFRPRIKKNNKKIRPIEVYKVESCRIRIESQFYFILFINIESQFIFMIYHTIPQTFPFSSMIMRERERERERETQPQETELRYVSIFVNDYICEEVCPQTFQLKPQKTCTDSPIRNKYLTTKLLCYSMYSLSKILPTGCCLDPPCKNITSQCLDKADKPNRS